MHRLIAATMLFAALTANPPDAGAFTRAEAERCLTNGVDWYTATFKGGRIGYMNASLARTSCPSGPCYALRENLQLKGLSAGVRFDQTLHHELDFAAQPPFRLMRGLLRMGDGLSIHLARNGQGYAADLEFQGERRTVQPPGPLDFTLAHYCAPRLWIQSGPGKAASLDGVELDIQQLAVVPRRFKVLDVASRPGGQRRFEVAAEIPGRARTRQTMDGLGRIQSFMAQGVLLQRSTREAAQAEAPLVDLLAKNTVRLNEPLKSPGQVAAWDLEGPAELSDKIMGGPQQDVLCDLQSCLIRLGRPNPEAATVRPEERAVYLEPVSGLPLDDPQLQQLARQATAGASSSLEKVERISAFVDAYITDVSGGVSMDVKQIMQLRQGDCGEHALLFTALCRAWGIPARMVLGYHPVGDPAEGLMGHGWAEAAVDGKWMEVDPINGGVVDDPLRLRTGVLGWDMSEDLFPLSGMELRVRKVERDSEQARRTRYREPKTSK
ncbi:MAG: transglutaminase-like domain-containing protein [Desulfovibrionaceae bacterium]